MPRIRRRPPKRKQFFNIRVVYLSEIIKNK